MLKTHCVCKIVLAVVNKGITVATSVKQMFQVPKRVQTYEFMNVLQMSLWNMFTYMTPAMRCLRMM